MPKETLKLSTILDSPILSRIIVGIGEVSEITGVSARQLRYWETKGIIDSIGANNGSNRRYNYPTIEKIVLLKDFLDQGYTLEAAARRLEERIQQLNKAIIKLSGKAGLKRNNTEGIVPSLIIDGNVYVLIGYATHCTSQQRFKIYASVNENYQELLAEDF